MTVPPAQGTPAESPRPQRGLNGSLLVRRIGRLITCAPPSSPAVDGWADAYLVILDGRVARIGLEVAIDADPEARALREAGREIDAAGRLVTPGLVDPHTHTLFAGWRADEFRLRVVGASYQEIMAAGGGIMTTVRATRAASSALLASQMADRLDDMLALGVTTVEVKSGYGLSAGEELRHLEAIRLGAEGHPVRVVATYLGAHAVPPEVTSRSAWLEEIIAAIPEVAERGLARFVDVFCEPGALTVEESRRVLEAGRAAGLGLKIHAEEFARSGGALLAAELGAVSADHLHAATEEDARALAAAGTTAVLLPATSFCLMERDYAPARMLRDAGVPVAIGTDFNPGSSPVASLPLVLSLACLGLRLTPEEALLAATRHAARAIGLEADLGSLELGKRGDLVIWDAESVDELPYRVGARLAEVVVAGGRVVARDGRPMCE